MHNRSLPNTLAHELLINLYNSEFQFDAYKLSETPEVRAIAKFENNAKFISNSDYVIYFAMNDSSGLYFAFDDGIVRYLVVKNETDSDIKLAMADECLPIFVRH